MIVIRLKGGLGNQMFQYAIGKQLSYIYNTKLILDLSFLLDKTRKENFTFRNFELREFNIKAECKSNFEFEYFYSNSLFSKVRRKISRINLISESDMRFNPSVLLAGKNIYLDGYWQCEKYFDSIRTELINEFSLKQNFLERLFENKLIFETKDLIEKSNSVSIHFRRGDYISNNLINSIHGTCSNEYYQNAIKYIKNKIPSTQFFLFSDDPEWLLTNQFDFPYHIVSTHNCHLDLYFMSLCKHNIIANSSFSWWGAWLNKNREKIIVAPKRWFEDEKRNAQTTNLIPETWIKI